MSTADELIAEGLATPIRGWDFSWMSDRAEETQPPWDYGALVREASRDSRLMLDVDTGGGEFLARLAPFPGTVVATEGHTPNVVVARERLAPFGIGVVAATSAPDNVDQAGTTPATTASELPFASSVCDLVIDRHSSYWPSEIRRVLRREGRFVTQQRSESGTIGDSWEQLFERPTSAKPRFDLAFAVNQLVDAGFHVARAEEADTPMTFRDLGAVVYYLRMVPWAVEAFDPIGDHHTLERIHRLIMETGALKIRGSHMILDARPI